MKLLVTSKIDAFEMDFITDKVMRISPYKVSPRSIKQAVSYLFEGKSDIGGRLVFDDELSPLGAKALLENMGFTVKADNDYLSKVDRETAEWDAQFNPDVLY